MVIMPVAITLALIGGAVATASIWTVVHTGALGFGYMVVLGLWGFLLPPFSFANSGIASVAAVILTLAPVYAFIFVSELAAKGTFYGLVFNQPSASAAELCSSVAAGNHSLLGSRHVPFADDLAVTVCELSAGPVPKIDLRFQGAELKQCVPYDLWAPVLSAILRIEAQAAGSMVSWFEGSDLCAALDGPANSVLISITPGDWLVKLLWLEWDGQPGIIPQIVITFIIGVCCVILARYLPPQRTAINQLRSIVINVVLRAERRVAAACGCTTTSNSPMPPHPSALASERPGLPPLDAPCVAPCHPRPSPGSDDEQIQENELAAGEHFSAAKALTMYSAGDLSLAMPAFGAPTWAKFMGGIPRVRELHESLSAAEAIDRLAADGTDGTNADDAVDESVADALASAGAATVALLEAIRTVLGYDVNALSSVGEQAPREAIAQRLDAASAAAAAAMDEALRVAHDAEERNGHSRPSTPRGVLLRHGRREALLRVVRASGEFAAVLSDTMRARPKLLWLVLSWCVLPALLLMPLAIIFPFWMRALRVRSWVWRGDLAWWRDLRLIHTLQIIAACSAAFALPVFWTSLRDWLVNPVGPLPYGTVGAWIVLPVALVLLQSVNGTAGKGLLRIAGTCLGALYAYIAGLALDGSGVILQSFIFIAVLFMMIFLGATQEVMLGAPGGYFDTRWGYAFLLSTYTALIVGLEASDTYRPYVSGVGPALQLTYASKYTLGGVVLARLVDQLVGVLLAMVTSACLYPRLANVTAREMCGSSFCHSADALDSSLEEPPHPVEPQQGAEDRSGLRSEGSLAKTTGHAGGGATRRAQPSKPSKLKLLVAKLRGTTSGPANPEVQRALQEAEAMGARAEALVVETKMAFPRGAPHRAVAALLALRLELAAHTRHIVLSVEALSRAGDNPAAEEPSHGPSIGAAVRASARLLRLAGVAAKVNAARPDVASLEAMGCARVRRGGGDSTPRCYYPPWNEEAAAVVNARLSEALALAAEAATDAAAAMVAPPRPNGARVALCCALLALHAAVLRAAPALTSPMLPRKRPRREGR
jgi:hypothetical protein